MDKSIPQLWPYVFAYVFGGASYVFAYVFLHTQVLSAVCCCWFVRCMPAGFVCCLLLLRSLHGYWFLLVFNTVL